MQSKLNPAIFFFFFAFTLSFICFGRTNVDLEILPAEPRKYQLDLNKNKKTKLLPGRSVDCGKREPQNKGGEGKSVRLTGLAFTEQRSRKIVKNCVVLVDVQETGYK